MDPNDYQILNAHEQLHFWYQARLILIKNLLAAVLLNQKEQIKIIDIGCGTGTELPILKKFGQVTAIDIDPMAVTIAQKNQVKIIQTNIEKYALLPNHYNAACAFDVLEHLQNDNQALKNIYQALQIGGYFFLTVPAIKQIFSAHDQAVSHYRRYSKKELKQKLTQAGFKIIYINYWNYILFPAQALIRLGQKIIPADKRKLKPNTAIRVALANNFIYSILKWEASRAPTNRRLPFGLSLYAVCQKPNKN